MLKSTPGPWRWFKNHNPKPEYSTTWYIDSKTRGHMAVLTVLDMNSSPKWREENPDAVLEHEETMVEVEANASLMAASPELYETLLIMIERAESAGWEDSNGDALDQARNAINKASAK